MAKDKMTDEEFKDKAAKLLTEQKLKDEEEAKAKAPATPKKSDEEVVADLAVKTLSGDIRDFLLDKVKQIGKPWVSMTEDEQSDQIHACRDAAETVVKKAVEMIASGGKVAIMGKLVKVQIKGNIQTQIDFSSEVKEKHSLYDAAGMAVSVVLADSKPFIGERAPAEPTPMQGSLLDKAEKLKASDDKVTTLKPKK